jgi:hypothetical protein
MGTGYIACVSKKISMVCLSTSETEQYSMAEGGTYAVWEPRLLEILGHKLEGPVRIYHDNNSAIWLSRNEGSFARTKHIVVKRGFVRELTEEGKILPIAMRGDRMPADMGTKPLGPKVIRMHMESIGMVALRTC